MYNNKTIKRYLEDLSSKKPTPGGGSAAALTATLACSLVNMVAHYSYADKNKKNKIILKDASNLNRKLIKLIDDDIVAYKKIVAILKRPKITKIQKNRRKKAIKKAYEAALSVPCKLSKLCQEGLSLTKKLVKVGNKRLVSDTAMSAILFEAAYKSALYNVKINLKSINDKKFSKKMQKEFVVLNRKVEVLKKEILKGVDKIL